MTEFHEFDYTVTKKPEGIYRVKRILMIGFYVLFGIVYFFGLAAAHFYPLMALIIFFEWMLVFFTWRYVSIEYKYSLVSGTMTFYEVYGGKKNKMMLEKKVKSFSEIRPLGDNEKSELAKRTFSKVYSFVRSDNEQSNKYFAIFEDDNAGECIVYFEATQKTLKILKYYNSNTEVINTAR